MHEDASWWEPFPVETLVSVMVAIDPATAENGALRVYPAYTDELVGGLMRNMNEKEKGETDQSTERLLEMEPGDLVFFHSFTPHRSGSNASDRSRRALFLTYSDGKHGDLYDQHYEHYHDYSADHSDEDSEALYFE